MLVFSKQVSTLLLTILFIGLIYTSSVSVLAVSSKQRAIYKSGNGYFDHEETLFNYCSRNTTFTGSAAQGITYGEGVWTTGSEPYVSGEPGPYTIELWAIHVLKNIARKAGVPESTMVNQNKVIALVAWAKAEGGGVDGHNGRFNPLNTKSVYSDLGGNLPSSSVDDNSSDYETFDIGIESITRALFNSSQTRIAGEILRPDLPVNGLIEAKAGDFVSTDGRTVINRWEDRYPGDKPYAMASVTGYTYDMPAYWPVGDRQKYIESTSGSLKSVLENYEAYAGKILDGSPPGTPLPLVYGSTGSGILPQSGCSTDTGVSLSVDGYAFPLDPSEGDIGGIRIGQTASEHHDETPAYDLFSSNENASVLALSNGVIDSVDTSFKGVEGCGAIHFKSDDGFYYWYGHLKKVSVADGDRVTAGQKIAEIADASYGTDCTDRGGPHLHIDKGCVLDGEPQRGGLDECRSEDFILLLARIYEETVVNAQQ